MKTIRKILPAIMLVTVMFVMSVVGVGAESGILTKEDTTLKVDINQYTGGYEIYRNADFENGAYLASAGGIFKAQQPANASNYTPTQIAGLSHLETATAARPGATSILGVPSTKYYTMTYEGNNPGGTHTYLCALFVSDDGKADTGKTRSEDGYIIEFDITCHPIVDDAGNVIASGAPDKPVPFQIGNDYNSYAAGMFQAFTVQSVDGDDTKFAIEFVGGAKESFAQGTWVHITIQFDPKGQYKFYVGSDDTNWGSEGVGRKLITTKSYIDNEKEVFPVSARVGGMATSGNVSYDNFIGYQGNCVRNPFYYDSLRGDDMFRYLVGQLTFVESAVTCKSVCDTIESDHLARYYNRATSEYRTSDEDMKSLVNQYLEYYDTNYEGLIEQAKAQNLTEYQNRVAALAAMPRSLYNHTLRSIEIEEIAAFLNDCGEYIDLESDEFIAAKLLYDQCIKDLDKDIAVADFVAAANKFVNAQKLGAVATMRKKYEQAYAVYIEVNPVASDYPVGDDGSYEKVAEAIEIIENADAILAEQTRITNTNRFVGIVDKISDTKRADWEADDGTIENLWRLALNIVAEDNYEKNLTFYEAYTRFADINNYFWEKTQDTHITALREKLAEFDSVVNYIEKESICTYIDSYLEMNKNEIDFEREEIIDIIALNTQNKDRLPSYKEDYKLELEANTEKFIGIVSRMSGVTAYAELKTIFDEATAYYYSMNISGDEAIAAVLTYERARMALEEVEYTNGVFVYEMSKITSGSSDDDVYKILVTCYSYYEGLDLTYSGSSAAKQSFDRLYSEYVASSSLANEQISEITAVVISVRSFCGVSDLMKYAADYLGN